jgi:hypothetical protein
MCSQSGLDYYRSHLRKTNLLGQAQWLALHFSPQRKSFPSSNANEPSNQAELPARAELMASGSPWVGSPTVVQRAER